jgi:hypothetical protein
MAAPLPQRHFALGDEAGYGHLGLQHDDSFD